MNTELIETSGTCRVEVRAMERESFKEYFVTATVDGAMPAGAAAADLFEQVAAVLVDKCIQPVQEKLYGFTSVRDEVLARRDEVYRAHDVDPAMPVTWLDGAPLNGGDFAGLQIWGIASWDGETFVRTVENPATGRGRLWTGRGFRMLHLPSVRGTTSAGQLVSGGPAAQAEQMFGNVGLGLRANGFSYPQVARTWIYVSRLLDWYDDLNRVRTAHYRRVGIGVEGGVAFPASTGIQCRSDDEECVMDVLALDSSDPEYAAARPIRRSPRQDSSFNYGSAFSRGLVLDINGRRTVHISGTASINAAGESIHIGDAEMQCVETLLCIAAILEEQGGGLEDITSATVFCKNSEAWEAWQRVSRLLQVPAFPKVCVRADVCRHDLLVEMEAVAAI